MKITQNKENLMLAKNTLFVCRNNIARSQLGAAYYNRWHPGRGFSAGTDVESRGEFVEDWDDPESQKFIWLAAGDGIAIAKTERRPVDKESLRNIGHVILMDLSAAEELEERNGSQIPWPVEPEVWDLPDPHHMSREEGVAIREIIKAKVAELATRSMMSDKDSFGAEVYMPGSI